MAAGIEVAGIVVRDPARRAAAAEAFPEARLLDHFDPRGYDLAVVATPNRSHAEVASAAVTAGVPVVVDKPFVRSAAEGEAVLAAAEAAGVPVTVFQNRRWDADFEALQQRIASGSLGAVTRFESRFERWRPQVDHSRWRESSRPDDAGGILLDLGSHLVDQALVLFGRPSQVYAEVAVRRAGAVVDDDAFVALTFPSGVQAHLWMSMTCPRPGARFRVQGALDGFESFGLDPQEDALRRGLRPGGPGWIEAVGATAGYTAFYRAVEQALRHGTPMPVDPHDALAALAVLDAARRSAADGVVVPIA